MAFQRDTGFHLKTYQPHQTVFNKVKLLNELRENSSLTGNLHIMGLLGILLSVSAQSLVRKRGIQVGVGGVK